MPACHITRPTIGSSFTTNTETRETSPSRSLFHSPTTNEEKEGAMTSHPRKNSQSLWIIRLMRPSSLRYQKDKNAGLQMQVLMPDLRTVLLNRDETWK
jgi:hypothetical protein